MSLASILFGGILMLGQNLNRVRKTKGFTAQHMADVLNISLSTYRKYESNSRLASILTLIKIADYLDVSLDFLTGRIEK